MSANQGRGSGQSSELIDLQSRLTMQMKQISFEESCGTIASVYPFQLSQELSEFGRVSIIDLFEETWIAGDSYSTLQSLERSLLSQDFSSEIMMEMDAIHPNHNLKRLSRDE